MAASRSIEPPRDVVVPGNLHARAGDEHRAATRPADRTLRRRRISAATRPAPAPLEPAPPGIAAMNCRDPGPDASGRGHEACRAVGGEAALNPSPRRLRQRWIRYPWKRPNWHRRYVWVVGSTGFWSVFALAILLALGAAILSHWRSPTRIWLVAPVPPSEKNAGALADARRTEVELRARLEQVLRAAGRTAWPMSAGRGGCTSAHRRCAKSRAARVRGLVPPAESRSSEKAIRYAGDAGGRA